jgi:hypothetical protein
VIAMRAACSTWMAVGPPALHARKADVSKSQDVYSGGSPDS